MRLACCDSNRCLFFCGPVPSLSLLLGSSLGAPFRTMWWSRKPTASASGASKTTHSPLTWDVDTAEADPVPADSDTSLDTGLETDDSVDTENQRLRQTPRQYGGRLAGGRVKNLEHPRTVLQTRWGSSESVCPAPDQPVPLQGRGVVPGPLQG